MSVQATEKGVRLGLAHKRAIRAECVREARRSGHRAYRFEWDGVQLLEFRAWPDGRCVVSKVTPGGISTEPHRRLLAVGVRARTAGWGAVALAVALDVLSRLLL